MKIAHVRINSILGIAELEFAAGKFNEISGRNGEGKTSVLEAIKAAVQPAGHDATLLRKGDEKGEVVLVLDNGTEVRKRVTEGSSPLTVLDREGKKQQRPADVMKQLSDMLSVNPVDFLRAPKKDRVRVLLEAMPLELDAQRLEEISGVPVDAEDGIHALAVIELVRKQVYDDRTGTNRAVKEKEVTINQLSLALPDAVDGVTGNEIELRQQVETANTTKDAELARIRDKLDGIKGINQGKIDAIRTEAQKKIDDIKATALAEVEAIQSAERDIEGKAGQQRELTIKRHSDAVTPINEQLAVITSNRSAQAKREQALDTVRQLEEDLEGLKQDAERQSKALSGIEQYKKDLLEGLPIPGVEVIDGEIYREGVVFDRLNTAQQVGIAVEIAKLRAGTLGVVCVDGLELLDKGAFEEFRDRCLESGLQLFVTRVTDEDFKVESSN